MSVERIVKGTEYGMGVVNFWNWLEMFVFFLYRMDPIWTFHIDCRFSFMAYTFSSTTKKKKTYVSSDDTQSPNSMSDLLLIRNTKTKAIIVTTNPIANVFVSRIDEGFKNILAFSSRQVDSVHVEYLPDFQS